MTVKWKGPGLQTPGLDVYAGVSPTEYGLWPLVVVNSGALILFALSFTRPRTGRDWRSMGAFSAFLVALFTEMYGFPLTIYLLSGWLGARFPAADIFSHQNGHIWQTLFGWSGDPHTNPIHLVSTVLIGGGFVLIAEAWSYLHRAQRTGGVATRGPYRYVRHPQYLGFIAIMVGFLIQWPTLITLLMFPILLRLYVRLARREERSLEADLAGSGESADSGRAGAYVAYVARTPAFLPRLPDRRRGPDSAGQLPTVHSDPPSGVTQTADRSTSPRP